MFNKNKANKNSKKVLDDGAISMADFQNMIGARPNNPFKVASEAELERKLGAMGLGELRTFAISCGVRATGSGGAIKGRIRREFDRFKNTASRQSDGLQKILKPKSAKEVSELNAKLQEAERIAREGIRE